MVIKEKIAARITKSRKELGITIKELASRTNSLSAARISNWEQGTRKPGPEEAKIIAEVLNVSASYLLGLTDNPQGELRSSSRFVPLVNIKDIPRIENTISEGNNSIILDEFNKSSESSNLFATLVEDNSMHPDLNQGDVIILDGARKPSPGDFVLAYLAEKNQTVLRKYGETESCLFQLLASNPLWATINVQNIKDVSILGVITEFRRYF
ncbi:helix-turn-helix domain-containing protein [Legionella sp. WA2024007413]